MAQDSVLALELFIVRNNKGQFFRAKGYNGVGESFTTNINIARVYGKLGPARSVVTYFANAFPDYPMLEIIKLNIGGFEVLDETERVRKAVEKKAKAEAAHKTYMAEYRLKEAQKALAEAQAKLNKLKK